MGLWTGQARGAPLLGTVVRRSCRLFGASECIFVVICEPVSTFFVWSLPSGLCSWRRRPCPQDHRPAGRRIRTRHRRAQLRGPQQRCGLASRACGTASAPVPSGRDVAHVTSTSPNAIDRIAHALRKRLHLLHRVLTYADLKSRQSRRRPSFFTPESRVRIRALQYGHSGGPGCSRRSRTG